MLSRPFELKLLRQRSAMTLGVGEPSEPQQLGTGGLQGEAKLTTFLEVAPHGGLYCVSVWPRHLAMTLLPGGAFFHHADSFAMMRGVRLVVLQLGNLDLTSSAGALMVKMLAAVADFERDLIIERTQAGQARARAAGTHMGRPSKTTPDQQRAIRKALAAGATVSSMAASYEVSRATIIAIRSAGD